MIKLLDNDGYHMIMIKQQNNFDNDNEINKIIHSTNKQTNKI